MRDRIEPTSACANKSATGALLVLAFVLITLASIVNVCQSHSIGDLEQRVTTFETVRIEMVAPPEGGQR